MYKISPVKQFRINTFFEGTKTWVAAQKRPEKKRIYARGVLMLTLVGVIAFLNTTSASATSSVSIAAPSRIDVELAPTSNGAVSYQTGDVVVTTTDTTGFKVMLSTASDTTALTSKVASQDAVIPSITTATKLSNLPVNTWGVYFGASTPTIDSTFSPITTTNKQYITNTNTNASGTYKLAIGAKADTSLKAGNYSNNLVISVIAEAPTITSLANATYMQDVTPEICTNSKVWSTEADSVSLIDSRDNKTYKVARLKDGNCWMQENLKLTLSTSKPLTPDDSDVSKNWTPKISTSITITDNRDMNGQASWSYGGYWYYQWNAAVAGSGEVVTADGGEAEDSICPKGWKLPTSGTMNDSKSDSFYSILKSYNMLSSASSTMNSPINLALTAQVWQGALRDSGLLGRYWSRTGATPANYAYWLEISSTGAVHPSYSFSRDTGIHVRCIAK